MMTDSYTTPREKQARAALYNFLFKVKTTRASK